MPLVEQGGLSHRSVLPQQVVPLGWESPIITAAGAESNFCNFSEPQFGQVMASSGSNPFWKNSIILPHSSQRYSYIGINHLQRVNRFQLDNLNCMTSCPFSPRRLRESAQVFCSYILGTGVFLNPYRCRPACRIRYRIRYTYKNILASFLLFFITYCCVWTVLSSYL
jgi:hypothetical protein